MIQVYAHLVKADGTEVSTGYKWNDSPENFHDTLIAAALERNMAVVVDMDQHVMLRSLDPTPPMLIRAAYQWRVIHAGDN